MYYPMPIETIRAENRSALPDAPMIDDSPAPPHFAAARGVLVSGLRGIARAQLRWAERIEPCRRPAPRYRTS